MVRLQISQNQDWKLEDIRGFKIVREGNFQLIFKSLINLSIKYKGRINAFSYHLPSIHHLLKSLLPNEGINQG